MPQGTLLIIRNYDEPGKIGAVGQRLGQAGVNVSFMTVAPIDSETRDDVAVIGSGGGGGEGGLHGNAAAAAAAAAAADGAPDPEKEALMILGVDRTVDESVRGDLLSENGVLEVGVVAL